MTKRENPTKYCVKMEKNNQNSGAGWIEGGEIALKSVNNYVNRGVSPYKNGNGTKPYERISKVSFTTEIFGGSRYLTCLCARQVCLETDFLSWNTNL